MDNNLKLFERFSASQRGPMANLILDAIRSGGTTVEEVYNRMIQDIEYKKRWPLSEARAIFSQLALESSFKELFNEATSYYLDWEKKSPEEKNKIKQKNALFWARSSMINKKPTEKQLWILNKNGITDFKGDRAEASAMIDTIKKNE